MHQLKKCFALFLIMTLMIPVTVFSASGVTVSRNGKKKTYSGVKTYITVNNKKVSLTGIPVFLKDGAYVGRVNEIFVKSGLGVKSSSQSNQKTLTLTYHGNVLKMTENSKKATINGKSTTLASAPIHATYTASKKAGWIVPLYSVCDRLGLVYHVKNGTVNISRNSAPAATTQAPKTTKATNTYVSKKKNPVIVVLDPGHGGNDSGAVGNGYREKDLTLSIVKAAKKYFDRDDRFKVYYTRTTDKTLVLRSRSTFANDKKADLFVSVHINSYGPTSHGTETLYYPGRDSSTKSKKLNLTSTQFAKVVHRHTLKATGFKDRGLVNRPNLSVLKNTSMPACLVEYGFITNKTEAESMNANTNKYGKSLYDAIVDATDNYRR